MFPWSSPKVEPVHIPIQPSHPYYPPSLAISTYLANTFGTLELVTAFATGCAVILGSAGLLVRWYNRKAPLSTWDISCVLWFVLCGCIHLFFEGYFVLNHTRMPAMGDFFGQLWKEYSLSDSRYMFSDPFVLCMESITAVGSLPLPSPTFLPQPTQMLIPKLSDPLGTSILPHSLSDCDLISLETSSASARLNWSILWRPALLCDEFI